MIKRIAGSTVASWLAREEAGEASTDPEVEGRSICQGDLRFLKFSITSGDLQEKTTN